MPHHSAAVALADWVDPADAFAVHSSAPHAFWLDAGAGAAEGWSYLGAGAPEPDESAVITTVLTRALPPDGYPAGPFRGGWVGWFDYERGAAAAGAPIARDGLSPPSTWLRVDRFLAFDHASRTRVGGRARRRIGSWASVSRDALARAASPRVRR